MARTITHGPAQQVTTESFNDRVKRLFDAKPDPHAKPEPKKPVRRQAWTGPRA